MGKEKEKEEKTTQSQSQKKSPTNAKGNPKNNAEKGGKGSGKNKVKDNAKATYKKSVASHHKQNSGKKGPTPSSLKVNQHQHQQHQKRDRNIHNNKNNYNNTYTQKQQKAAPPAVQMIDVEYEWGTDESENPPTEFMNLKLAKYDAIIATVKPNGDVILTSNGHQNRLTMKVLNMLLYPLNFQIVFIDGSLLEDKEDEEDEEDEGSKIIWTVKSLSYKYQVQFEDEMQISAFASRDWHRYIKYELQNLPESIPLHNQRKSFNPNHKQQKFSY